MSLSVQLESLTLGGKQVRIKNKKNEFCPKGEQDYLLLKMYIFDRHKIHDRLFSAPKETRGQVLSPFFLLHSTTRRTINMCLVQGRGWLKNK
jgi:hypothetical protein